MKTVKVNLVPTIMAEKNSIIKDSSGKLRRASGYLTQTYLNTINSTSYNLEVIDPSFDKLIATTDKHISFAYSIIPAALPQSFVDLFTIDDYIYKYNHGEIVTEILVDDSIDNETPHCSIYFDAIFIKTSWNEKEVRALCSAAFHHKDVNSGLPYDYNDNAFDQWCTKNLTNTNKTNP